MTANKPKRCKHSIRKWGIKICKAEYCPCDDVCEERCLALHEDELIEKIRKIMRGEEE